MWEKNVPKTSSHELKETILARIDDSYALSTGITALDELIGENLPGDFMLWNVSNREVYPFVVDALADWARLREYVILFLDFQSGIFPKDGTEIGRASCRERV